MIDAALAVDRRRHCIGDALEGLRFLRPADVRRNVLVVRREAEQRFVVEVPFIGGVELRGLERLEIGIAGVAGIGQPVRQRATGPQLIERRTRDDLETPKRSSVVSVRLKFTLALGSTSL